MENVLSLVESLEKLSPEHDTPVGLIHPYWARKPLNIVRQLIREFSKKGDVVADPFVGSGTTVFAALSEGRKVIASDLNPLSIFVTESIVDLLESPKEKIKAAHQFIDDLSAGVLPLFHYCDDFFVERERFLAVGEYEGGNFELIPTEIVLKKKCGKTLKGRRVEKPIPSWMAKKATTVLSNTPINFEAVKLRPNSRIAIPNGAILAHYYEYKNQISINLALQLIASGKYGRKNENVLKLLLSASLPLLRLSDKKASSQWPYWRPKEHLTSRNPIPVLLRKLQAIENAVEWLQANVAGKDKQKLSDRVQLYNVPIQSLIPKYVQHGQADLVLTDPPYSDQAPYLEYSALWIELIGLKLPAHAYKHEIVKTDAPSRVDDSNDYIPRLRQGLRACTQLLKPEGSLIWFYQDHSVEHWAAIAAEAAANGLSILNVVPMAKQRRSMKTVTSPGATLDGDLILIFKKTSVEARHQYSIEQARRIILDELAPFPDTAPYFDKYAAIVKAGLKFHLFGPLSQSYKDIRKILPSMDNWR
ncbi:MAG: DNA methyltransferase [Desulfobulbus sp.]|nr:DNA methyltransferase [Desulfobulbus sp.]